jgi:hypothetical protein
VGATAANSPPCLFAFTLLPMLLTLTPAFSSLLSASHSRLPAAPRNEKGRTNGDLDGRKL